MKKQFLTLEKAKQLEEIIGFLTGYKPTEGEIHHIGPTIDEVDEKYTQLLRRLGELHIEEEKIMKEFLK